MLNMKLSKEMDISHLKIIHGMIGGFDFMKKYNQNHKIRKIHKI